jgi:hypothetical protein
VSDCSAKIRRLLLLREFGTELRWPGFGLLFLSDFIVMRATSFHPVDRLLGLQIGGWLKVNAVLELGGSGCIAAAALRRWRQTGRIRRP